MTLLPLNRGFSFICSLFVIMANSIQVLPVIEWRAPGPTQAQINAKAIAKQPNAFQQSPFVTLFAALCIFAPSIYSLGTVLTEATINSPSIEYRQ